LETRHLVDMENAPVLLLLLLLLLRWGSRFVAALWDSYGDGLSTRPFGVCSVFDPTATMIYLAAKRLCFCSGLLGKKNVPQGVCAPCWPWLNGRHTEDAPGFSISHRGCDRVDKQATPLMYRHFLSALLVGQGGAMAVGEPGEGLETQQSMGF